MYYLLCWKEDITTLRESFNVEQPSPLGVCLDEIKRVSKWSEYRYFVVPDEEYQTYWKDKITS
jgi:hypothetical protein